MLFHKFTRIFETEHAPVLSGHLIEEEGYALVRVFEGLQTVVRKSTGAADEAFVGFAMSRNAPAGILPLVAEGNADGTQIILARVPLTGDILLKLDGVNATIVAGAPAASGEVNITGDVVTLHDDDADVAYFVQFMYEPSVTEARQYTGDFPIGGLASASLDVLGILNRGFVATNMFDMSADWVGSGEVVPSLGADGRLTIGGPGTKLTGTVQIHSVPSSDNPFLVVRVNA